MPPKRLMRSSVLLIVAVLGLSAFGSALAETLTLDAPISHSFGGIGLDGTDRTITDNTLVIGVEDATGSSEGWHVDITSTTFSTGGETPRTLPTDAATITAVAFACASGTCTDPDNNVAYPVAIPAGDTSPPPVKWFNAAVGTGSGDFDLTLTITLAMPANSYAGTYTSTITTTIATGP